MQLEQTNLPQDSHALIFLQIKISDSSFIKAITIQELDFVLSFSVIEESHIIKLQKEYSFPYFNKYI